MCGFTQYPTQVPERYLLVRHVPSYSHPIQVVIQQLPYISTLTVWKCHTVLFHGKQKNGMHEGPITLHTRDNDIYVQAVKAHRGSTDINSTHSKPRHKIEVEWRASRHGRFTPKKITQLPTEQEERRTPQPVWEKNTKIPYSCRNSSPGPSSP